MNQRWAKYLRTKAVVDRWPLVGGPTDGTKHVVVIPIRAEGAPLDAIRQAMSLDKKTEGGANRWVMLEDVGRATVRRDVPTELVEETLQDLVG